MPRAAQSPAAGILQFFRTASIEAATQLLDLCRAEVRGRIGKSQAAKARAKVAPPAATPVIAADRPKRKVKAKAKSKGRAAKTPVQSILPDPGPGAEAGEAGDAPQA